MLEACYLHLPYRHYDNRTNRLKNEEEFCSTVNLTYRDKHLIINILCAFSVSLMCNIRERKGYITI